MFFVAKMSTQLPEYIAAAARLGRERTRALCVQKFDGHNAELVRRAAPLAVAYRVLQRGAMHGRKRETPEQTAARKAAAAQKARGANTHDLTARTHMH